MIYKEDLTPYQLDVINAKICPYCKSKTKVITELEVYKKVYSGKAIIACVNYPACDSYVGTHSNGEPLGRLANQNLRLKKKKYKEAFNMLWENKYMSRADAYEELSEFLELDPALTHFGMFSEVTCYKAHRWALEKLVEFDKEK